MLAGASGQEIGLHWESDSSLRISRLWLQSSPRKHHLHDVGLVPVADSTLLLWNSAAWGALSVLEQVGARSSPQTIMSQQTKLEQPMKVFTK